MHSRRSCAYNQNEEQLVQSEQAGPIDHTNAQGGAMRSYRVTTMTVQYAQSRQSCAYNQNEQRDRSIIRSLRSRTNAQSGAIPHAMSTTMTVAVICRDAVIIAADAVLLGTAGPIDHTIIADKAV